MKKRKIIFVSGEKGGVGKTTIALALQHFIPCQAIDGDASNPDFARPIGESAQKFDLKKEEGWNELFNHADNHDRDIIISCPAGIESIYQAQKNALDYTLKQLNAEGIMIWPINRQRDSIEALQRIYHDCPCRLIVILNGYFGEAEKFSLWNHSDIRKAFLKTHQECYFPHLIDTIADKLNTKALTYKEALTSPDMRIGDKANTQAWLTKIEQTLLPLIYESKHKNAA